MPNDQNQPQNPTPEENPSPASPSSSAQGSGGTQQEPTPLNTAHSKPSEADFKRHSANNLNQI